MLLVDADTCPVLLASCCLDFGKVLPWEGAEMKREPDLQKLQPVKLLHLKERQTGLQCAGEGHRAVAAVRAIAEAQMQTSTGGKFCHLDLIGVTALVNTHIRCIGYKKHLWCQSHPALSYPCLPKRKVSSRILK